MTRRDILERAYDAVKANKGAAGLDRVTLQDIEQGEGREAFLDRLQQDLEAGEYHPMPVRRVYIPKPQGGERPLGIPPIRDRVVQTAAKLVLEPIFEAHFLPHSYGFRPKRNAIMALEVIRRSGNARNLFVVDADIRQFFDHVDHEKMLLLLALREYYRPHLAGLCEDCQSRYERAPMRLLDCKQPHCHEVASEAPRSVDYLCPECQTHLDGLTGLLTLLGVVHRLDSNIVRGLDYYTRTVFEIIHNGLTVCGGGRYDGLVETLGGPPTPAVGFGLGLERLLLVLEQSGLPLPGELVPQVLIVADNPLPLARDLRREGFRVEVDLQKRSLKAQLKMAGKRGIPYVVIAGSEEAQRGRVALRNMADGTQREVDPRELPTLLASL